MTEHTDRGTGRSIRARVRIGRQSQLQPQYTASLLRSLHTVGRSLGRRTRYIQSIET